MNYFGVADWHIGDPRIEILGRPFSSSEEMLKTLIKNHNKVVEKNDVVIVIGDVCYKEAIDKIDLISNFNGKKILIRGNHDVGLSDEVLKKYFIKVIPDGEGMELTCGGVECYATHYPTKGREDKFNIIGHVHGIWRYNLNMFNLGVDANHFCPVNLETIPKHLKAIKEFYDEDAWACYNKINTQFIGKRGRKGSYFKG